MPPRTKRNQGRQGIDRRQSPLATKRRLFWRAIFAVQCATLRDVRDAREHPASGTMQGRFRPGRGREPCARTKTLFGNSQNTCSGTHGASYALLVQLLPILSLLSQTTTNDIANFVGGPKIRRGAKTRGCLRRRRRQCKFLHNLQRISPLFATQQLDTVDGEPRGLEGRRSRCPWVPSVTTRQV